MAYIRETDLTPIQSDVLTTDTSVNTSIKKKNQLRTTSKIINGAINEISARITDVNDTAVSAKSSVAELNNNITAIVSAQVSQKLTESAVGGNLVTEEFAGSDTIVTFKLAKKPNDINSILFFVNGIKYILNKDYSYDEETNSLTWIGIKSESRPRGFELSSTDELSIIYMSSENKTGENTSIGE